MRTVSGERSIARTRPATDAPANPGGRCKPVTQHEFPIASGLRRCRGWQFVPPAMLCPSILRVSHHEAGHAVLLEWVGLDVCEATAEPSKGLCTFKPPKIPDGHFGKDESGQLCATAAAVFHAGVIAELLCEGRSWKGPIFYPQQKDYQDADDMLCRSFGRHASGAHAFAQQVALHVLSARWDRVRQIADHLVENGRWSPHDSDRVGSV